MTSTAAHSYVPASSSLNQVATKRGKTAAATCSAWAEGKTYAIGDVVSYDNALYTCIQAHTAYAGAGWYPPAVPALWNKGGTCGGAPPTPAPSPKPTSSPKPTPIPVPTPPGSAPPSPNPRTLVFSPYKDISINMNWNTNVISTSVTGYAQNLLSVLPSGLNTVTWAFATGECGAENWGGLMPASVAAANVQAFVDAGKKYIISTGGASGSFTCSSDTGFQKFIETYYSANMIGVDFDIEAGQSDWDISNLIQRVKAAQVKYPRLRFSFTLATLGGNSPQSLGYAGIQVMSAIKSSGLSNYLINLMTMDYGSPVPSVCTVVNGICDMAQSAISAAKNLNSYWGVPFSQMELTPMIGGNDTQGETFTIGNVFTLSAFAHQKSIAGIHFWSFDRDTDCAPGYASPTCNSYGQGGVLGFTKSFLTVL